MSTAARLARAVALLPADWRAGHAPLLAPHVLARLAGRLDSLASAGVPANLPPPHFACESTPSLADAFAHFRPALTAADEDAPRLLADAVRAAGCAGVLLLLGQRRTPASLTDVRGVPPDEAVLLAAADAPCRAGGVLSAAARAWAKHAPRSADVFWGSVRGGPAEQNAAARRLLVGILAGATWWNVFGHYLHGEVFEARLPTGHGARWGAAGQRFIGFVEPFEE